MSGLSWPSRTSATPSNWPRPSLRANCRRLLPPRTPRSRTLKAKLDAGEVARKLAVTEALSAVEKERDALGE
jgi:hypothetical protein